MHLARRVIHFLLLISPITLKAQNCFVQRDETTGNITKSAITTLTDSLNGRMNFTMSKQVDSVFIGLSFTSQLSGNTFNSMELSLVFNDGRVKQYVASGQSNAVVFPNGTAVIFQTAAHKDDLISIGSFLLTELRLTHNGNQTIIIHIDNAEADEIRNSVSCLSN